MVSRTMVRMVADGSKYELRLRIGNTKNKKLANSDYFSINNVEQSISYESHSLQLQVERVLSICRRLDPGSLFLRNKTY